MPDTDTRTTGLAQFQAAFTEARDQLKTYVDGVEAAHRAQYPDPVGPDGRPHWSEEQALKRTAAWTDDEYRLFGELRAVQHEAVMALHRARQSAGQAEVNS